MLAIVSPSKDLDFKSSGYTESNDIPRLWNQSLELVHLMKTKSKPSLKKLMTISDKLAEENINRYKNMSSDFTDANSKPALFAFSGDVYRGIDCNTLDNAHINYLQQNLRILSGLYGLLRPLDRIQAYRLEMGLALKISSKTKNLYQFWTQSVTELLQQDLLENKHSHLINLASDEYFQSIDQKKIKIPIIHVHFRELRNGKLSFLSYNAKKARGLMVRYMAINKVGSLDSLLKFNLENYFYDPSQSDESKLFFIR